MEKRKILRTIKIDPKDWHQFGKLANSIASDRTELIRRAIRAMLRDKKLLNEIIRKGGG